MSAVKGVAVVGAGIIYKNHAKALEAIPNRARLVGVAELDPTKRERASEGIFVPIVTEDYQELLARDDVDIVAVCTPPSVHEQVVVDALKAGKYVICEKPLAQSLAITDRIVSASQDFPNRLGTVYQLRYLPDIQQIIRLRDEGTLGKLLFGNFQRFGFLNKSQAGIEWWGSWGVAGGGVVATQFIHLLDLMLYIYGTPVAVQAWMSTLKNPIQSEDTFTATVQFENGASVSAVASLAAHHSVLMSLDIYGEKVSVHYPWNLRSTNQDDLKKAAQTAGRALQIERARGKVDRVIRIAKRVSARYLNTKRPDPPPIPHTAYYERVLDAIDANAPLPVPPEEARRSVELFTAIYESAMTRQTVTLPLDDSCQLYNGITLDDYDGRKGSPHSDPVTAQS